MINMAELWIKRPRFEPWLGYCVVFLGKALYAHSASLHHGKLTKCWEVTCEGVAILLVASCYRNWDKPGSNGPLGS